MSKTTLLSFASIKLRNEWNEDKNGPMENYTPGSGKKVFWICGTDNHHQWPAIIYNRTSKNSGGCPICSNKKICSLDYCNSLFFSHSHLNEEWNEDRNGSMKNYPPRSNKKVFWICKTNKHHQWSATIASRTREKPTGCPICSNKKICSLDHCNSLFFSHPYLNKEWNEDKNGSMKNYTPSSGKKVFWICKTNKHHKWSSTISSRTSKKPTGCPICSNRKICPLDRCNSLFFSHPHLNKEWNEDKNGSMKNYFSGSHKKVLWICFKDNYRWYSTINHRTSKKPRGCPRCNFSKLEKEFEGLYTKNNYDVIYQAKFDGCKNINHLPFDGYFPTLKILVELDGVQHFNYIEFFYQNKDKFIARVITDIKKNVFGFKMGESMIRLPYNTLGNLSDKIKEFRELCSNNPKVCFHRYYLSDERYIEFKRERDKKDIKKGEKLEKDIKFTNLIEEEHLDDTIRIPLSKELVDKTSTMTVTKSSAPEVKINRKE